MAELVIEDMARRYWTPTSPGAPESNGIWWAAGMVRADRLAPQWSGPDARDHAVARRAEFSTGMAQLVWRRNGETEWRYEPCPDDLEAVEAWLADDYVYIPF